MTFRIFFGTGGPPQPKGKLLAQATTLAGVGNVIDPPKVYMRPDNDIVLGGWVDQDDGNSNIYQTLDEITAVEPGLTIPIGTPPGGFGIMGHPNANAAAQNFISIGTVISSVRLWLGKNGTPTGNVTVKICTVDASHHPLAQIGVTSNTHDIGSLTDVSLTPLDFTFSSPIAVTDGGEYCFLVERSTAPNTTNYVFIGYESGTNNYEGSTYCWHYFNGAAEWVAQASYDIVAVIDQQATGDLDFVKSPPIAYAGAPDTTIVINDFVGGNAVNFGNTSFQILGQSFISIGSFVSGVWLWIAKVGAPTDGVRVKLYAAGADHRPTGAEIGTSNTVVAAALFTSHTAVNFIFAHPITVTEGARYCFVVERTGALHVSNMYQTYYAGTSGTGPYALGQFVFYNGVWEPAYDYLDLVCMIEQAQIITTEIRTGNSVTVGADFKHKVGQTFLSIGETINSISVGLAKFGTTDDAVRLKLHAVASGIPGALIREADATIPASGLSSGNQERTFTFTPPVDVVPGNSYCFTLERTGALDASGANVYTASYATAVPSFYPNGQYIYEHSDSLWKTDGSTTDVFSIIDQTAPVGGSNIAIGAPPPSGMTIFGHPTNVKYAQTFVSVGTTISSIKIHLQAVNSPTGNVLLKIFTNDGSGFPQTQVGVTSNLLPASSITPNFSAEYVFTFSPPIAVTYGGTYSFTVEKDGALSSTNNFGLGQRTTNPYAGGTLKYHDGTSWWALSNNDVVAVIDQRSAVNVSANLTVRLFDGSTEIAQWTHDDVAEEFADAVQTLTAPQAAAISDFSNLFAELDDNQGNVYRFALGAPDGSVAPPIKVKYRYKKLAA